MDVLQNNVPTPVHDGHLQNEEKATLLATGTHRNHPITCFDV